MLRIVVIARCKSIETTGQAVDGRVETDIIVIWKDDVEIAIELCCGEFAAAFRYKSKAYQVSL